MKLLQLDNLSKKFGGVTAISGLSFSVEEGSIHAVIGPNGAGKSTLFNVISGLYAPSSGHMRLAGRSLDGLDVVALSRLGVARTFQKIRIFKTLNAIENVIMGSHYASTHEDWRTLFGGGATRRARERRRSQAASCLALLGLGDQAHARADTLSYGQQRMLEIARSLATRPRLLLLDEPAAGLNLAEAEELVDRIRKIRELGITVMLVEHNMDMIMDIADEIMVMNFGEKLAQGTPAQVQSNPVVMSAYLGTG